MYLYLCVFYYVQLLIDLWTVLELFCILLVKGALMQVQKLVLVHSNN